MRRYSDPIDVREAVPSSASVDDTEEGFGPGRPEAFLWRNRLYVVRAVLGHWSERRAWWRSALEDDRPDDAFTQDGLEEEIWRVEASPGRLLGTGVYDLGRGSGWRLLGVAD